MIRRILEIRYIAYALIALAMTICAIEIGLQIRATRYGSTLTKSQLEQLTVPSWQSHHQLRPNTRSLVREPDSDSQIEIRVNSFGLRGPEPTIPKPEDVYRILCLGDETIFAAEVNESDSLTNRLQNFLHNKTGRNIEVLNGGVPGYCPLLSCLQLRSSLVALDADLIVLNFDMTDIADDHKYRRHVNTDETGVPIGCQHPSLVTDQQIQYADILDKFHLSRLARECIGDVMNERDTATHHDIESPKSTWAWTSNDPPDWSIYIRHALEPIVHMHQQAQDMATDFVLACSPSPWQVSPEAGNSGLRRENGIPGSTIYSSRRPFELLSTVANKYEITFFEPTFAFHGTGQPERLFLRSSRGFSRYGHALYAHELSEFILQKIPAIQRESISTGQPVFRQATTRRALKLTR